MATFAIILNKCEISFTEDKIYKPQFFENKSKIHVFLKRNNLWFILITLNKKLPLCYLIKFLEIMALKVR